MKRRYTEIEKQLMKDIGNNLNKTLKRKGCTQKELSELTGISTSSISDYVNGNKLMSPGKLHIIAAALHVSKGEIDPTYSNLGSGNEEEPQKEEVFNPLMIFELVDKYTDDEIIEKYHHQDEDGTLTESQVRMHLQYVRFLKTQK